MLMNKLTKDKKKRIPAQWPDFVLLLNSTIIMFDVYLLSLPFTEKIMIIGFDFTALLVYYVAMYLKWSKWSLFKKQTKRGQVMSDITCEVCLLCFLDLYT